MHKLAVWSQWLQTQWSTRPWVHWAIVFAIPMSFFLIDKLVTLSAILTMYASSGEHTFGNKLGGVVLGMLEDLSVTCLLITALLLLELVRWLLSLGFASVTRDLDPKVKRGMRIAGLCVRAVVVFGCVALTLTPFACDMLLLRIRDMRFTTDLIATYKREKAEASSLEVEPREVRLAILMIVGVVLTSLVFTVVYVGFVDLARLWRSEDMQSRRLYDTIPSPPSTHSTLGSDLDSGNNEQRELSAGSVYVSVADKTPTAEASTPTAEHEAFVGPTQTTPLKQARLSHVPFLMRATFLVAGVVAAYITLVSVTCAIAKASGPVIAAIALNASLNELFRSVFHVEFQRGIGSGDIKSAAYYLHPQTEQYELFKSDVLYRKTKGFNGSLAFDVKVDEKDPPNVLIITVESFRYMDSLLMAGNTTAGELLAKSKLSVTPQFDRWAKRGVAFNNMWSSWQTSRSLEAILFGQLVYDSITNTGTTNGKQDTKLSGLPQFFKQKGYETVFTTGCRVDYDQWDSFLPSHGFETVYGAPHFIEVAERDYGISPDDWYGPPHRGFGWGVHDDLSFSIIGDLILNKTKEQHDRVQKGEPKQPFFMDHYTISSHMPFDSYPEWFENETLPDFSPLCEGWGGQCSLIQKYSKLRYFTDMELGKFLDRMEAAGVLNDTIVFIAGDHGQSPEMGLANQDVMVYQTATTQVAATLVAEGRLGEYAGLVIEDATHHYDLLNTLMDIVGVPADGFLQTGIGRSLKRAVPFGERRVYSNNPMKKLSVVQGHKRFVYDRTSNDMGLFDTVHDPLEKANELPSQTADDKIQWQAVRQAGRELNAYFKKRWDDKCLTQTEC